MKKRYDFSRSARNPYHCNRDIGQEILDGIREIKRGEHGRVATLRQPWFQFFMNKKWLLYTSIWLCICGLAGLVAAQFFHVSFWTAFAIAAGALLLNGVVAEIEDRRPGGFLNPRREHPPIDALEKKIRLGCGLIAGLVVGLFVGFLSLNLVAGPLFAFAIALAVLFGVLAVRYGDTFWTWILRYW